MPCSAMPAWTASTAEQLVAGAVAQMVVGLLQAVQVKAGHPQAGKGRPAVRHLAELVPVVHPGEGVLKAHPPEGGRLSCNLLFLGLDLLLEVLVGLPGHLDREAHIVLHHLLVGVGDVDVAAAQPPVRPAEHSGDALVHPQADAGGGVGGDPHPAGAQPGVRPQGQGAVGLTGDVAPGHLAGKPAEDLRHGVQPRRVLVFRRAQPHNVPVHQRDDGLHIVFAVVLVHHQAGEGLRLLPAGWGNGSCQRHRAPLKSLWERKYYASPRISS